MTLRGAALVATVWGMGRAHVQDYTGATKRIDVAAALALDDRWAAQPKVDGCYARVTLDEGGRVARVQARSGELLAAAADLRGIVAGAPHSVLHGELEAHTEAGIRAAATRGWAALHLFDVTQVAGVDVGGLPYAERYALLHRQQAQLETDGPGRVRSWAVDGQGDAHDARGRYTAQVPRDLRRLPIVPMVRGREARAALWRDHVERGGGEGLVAVRLDARAGARAAKAKVKQTDTLDALVVAAGRAAIRVTARGLVWVMPGRAPVGAIVEVAHDGWYEADAVPRFPRLVRVRTDLAPAAPAAPVLH